MFYLVATPIGNLEDISFRAVRILREADLILSEDTRRTKGLLNHLQIKNTLLSCHEHNEKSRIPQVLALLDQGKTVAFVSDAGMPGISDPGMLIARSVIDANHPYSVLPGASAALTALLLSGLSCERFAFEGFLPRDKKTLDERISSLKFETRTCIFYESPLRLRQTLESMRDLLSVDRQAAVCRELTKIYETCVRGTLAELCDVFAENPRGECVIILGPAEKNSENDQHSLDEILAKMDQLIRDGKRAKEAAKALADENYSSRELYSEYLKKTT